ncbi:TonB-dependent receptor [Massilia sp. B-10]|nr:TonB-dependent receptor [Massilia sp. B-10]
MRGLGGDKTLVLLNGRRLANHPFFADTVDLNIIPVAALDRVEVLRDGASAIYGTDAIGGVVNFITKRSYTGMGVTAEAFVPTQSGGGDEARINFTGGWGDLNNEGWNLLAVADYHRQAALRSEDRPFSNTGVRPGRGVSQTSGTPFPANFFSDNGIVGNPSYATGCLPPRLDSHWRSGQPDLPLRLHPLHRQHPAHDPAILPGPVDAKDRRRAYRQPGIPAQPQHQRGARGAAAAGRDRPDHVRHQPLLPGRLHHACRARADRRTARRQLASAGDGAARHARHQPVRPRAGQPGRQPHRWDYNTGISYSAGRAQFLHGRLRDRCAHDRWRRQRLAQSVRRPDRGLSTAFLQDSLLRGQFLKARINSSAIDFKASRDMMAMGGGQLGFAIGGELRHDKATYTVDRALAYQASSSGFADAQDQRGSRTIRALFAEVNMPFTKAAEVNVAGRYDYYTDVGGNFQSQDRPALPAHGTGAVARLLQHGLPRAHAVRHLRSANGHQYGRTVGRSGAVPGRRCRAGRQSEHCLQPAAEYPPGRQPQRPARRIAHLQCLNRVRADPQSDPVGRLLEHQAERPDQRWPNKPCSAITHKYSNLFVYNASNTRLDYVLATTTNLGEIRTRGVDLSMLWRLPKNPWGNFTLAIDGTWVQKYDYQNEPNGPFTENAGRYADASPVFRWRHNATLSWSMAPWTFTLGNRYLSGYDDQNAVDPQFSAAGRTLFAVVAVRLVFGQQVGRCDGRGQELAQRRSALHQPDHHLPAGL